MAATQLKALKPKHDAIVDHICANPEITVTALAGVFEVTVPWMSIIMHSEVFKEALAKKSQEIFDTVIVPTRTKMVAVADEAYEKLAHKVPFIEDPKLLLDIADRTANKLGYGPAKGPTPVPGSVTNIQTNTYVTVDRESLHRAREQMHKNNNKEETIDVPVLPTPG